MIHPNLSKAISDSNKKRIGKNHPLWGKSHSLKTKKKMSIARKNRQKDGPSAEPSWSGGILKSDGYVTWSKAKIHYCNGNGADNRIKNLLLMTKSDHTKYHNEKRYSNA